MCALRETEHWYLYLLQSTRLDLLHTINIVGRFGRHLINARMKFGAWRINQAKLSTQKNARSSRFLLSTVHIHCQLHSRGKFLDNAIVKLTRKLFTKYHEEHSCGTLLHRRSNYHHPLLCTPGLAAHNIPQRRLDVCAVCAARIWQPSCDMSCGWWCGSCAVASEIPQSRFRCEWNSLILSCFGTFIHSI